MALRSRVNRYDWLSQRLLITGRHDEILWLHKQSRGSNHFGSMISNHLDHVHGIVRAKYRSEIDSLIISLQQDRYDKSIDHFLLVCRCLIWRGDHDTVVAICRQFINKEADLNAEPTSEGSDDNFLGINKIFEQVEQNSRLNEPKFWFIFALSLGYQRQFKDASQAFKISIRLTSGRLTNPNSLDSNRDGTIREALTKSYYDIEMGVFYANFCISNEGDLRTALEVLDKNTIEKSSVAPLMALIQSISRPLAFNLQLKRAIQTIADAEVAILSNQNPSARYTDLVWRCNREQMASSIHEHNSIFGPCVLTDSDRQHLNLVLAKSHILLNQLIVDSSESSKSLYKVCFKDTQQVAQDSTSSAYEKQIDMVVASLASCKPLAWSSAAFWNNLGLCYLMKNRLIACLGCLLRAIQIEPLDWRINCNLAIACAHVGLLSRAFIFINASLGLHPDRAKYGTQHSEKSDLMNLDSSIKSLMAVCLAEMDDLDGSRQLHIESYRLGTITGHSCILTHINYLIFLHKYVDKNDQQANKTKQLLLDQLEQLWLKRNLNNPQFNKYLLNIATSISMEMSCTLNSGQRVFAWTRVENC